MLYDPDIPAAAAKAWAQAHAPGAVDPVKFGHDVALVFLAAEQTLTHQGDEKATTAALAALSVPTEVWQSLGLLSSLLPRTREQGSETGDRSGAEA